MSAKLSFRVQYKSWTPPELCFSKRCSQLSKGGQAGSFFTNFEGKMFIRKVD
jgi:hypothetical protein